jgi:hypothetical protein
VAAQLGDRACVAFFGSLLAGGFHAARQLGEARQRYEEALAIRRQLEEAQPGVFQPDVAMNLFAGSSARLGCASRARKVGPAPRTSDIPDSGSPFSEGKSSTWSGSNGSNSRDRPRAAADPARGGGAGADSRRALAGLEDSTRPTSGGSRRLDPPYIRRVSKTRPALHIQAFRSLSSRARNRP